MKKEHSQSVLKYQANHSASNNPPLVSIGWLLAVDERDAARIEAFQQASQLLRDSLAQQFPQFRWEMPFIRRGFHAPHGALEPLALLEMGVHEKTYHADWDFVLVVVPNELHARQRIFTIGVPSSALEVGVLSSARINWGVNFSDHVAALAAHILGHMWGLEHDSDGLMAAPENCEHLAMIDYTPDQKATIIDRLDEVSDQRLEERKRQWNWFTFHWHTFWADPKGILIDILGYRPWVMPFRMGRLTSAAAVSIIFALMGSEAWDIGTRLPVAKLLIGSLVSIGIATQFIYFGQNLGQIARDVGWREQITRTHIVLYSTLLVGMSSLWLILFLVSLAILIGIPTEATQKWLAVQLSFEDLLHHAAFMAALGVSAAALGGNLEDEEDLKVRLFYDEET